MEFHKSGRVYDFMSIRRYWFAFSAFLAIASAIGIWKPGLKYGIDFMGGTELTVRFERNVDPAAIRSALVRMGNERPEVVPREAHPNEYIIRIEKTSAISPAQARSIRERLDGLAGREEPALSVSEFRVSPGGDHLIVQFGTGAPDATKVAQLLTGAGANVRGNNAIRIGAADDHRWQVPLVGIGDTVFRTLVGPEGVNTPGELVASVWVSPKAGKELRDQAVQAVLYSLVFIMIYVAFRFDLRFAPGGILALAHDALVALGFFVLTRKEVTISTVAAILTVVGYSMNDTVIVYDRVRENLAKRRGVRMLELINVSVSEMLSRTILTSLTVVLSVSAFAVIGTGVIRDFAWAMIVGVIAGTYSSIYVAAPLTEWIDSRFFHNEPAPATAGPGAAIENAEKETDAPA